MKEDRMELSEVIRGRRSVRRFKPDEVEPEVIEKLFDLAMWAPSGMNRQVWYFVVVKGQKKEEFLKISATAFDEFRPLLEKTFKDKPKIVEGMQRFFETYGGAPVIVFAYAGKLPNGDDDVCSTAVAVQNLLLAAHEAGLGAVWTDGVLIKESEINSFLGIEGQKLVSVIPLGYPDEVPKAPPRREGRVAWLGF
jgi:nitroreductase